jgi:hypothetical protein
MATAWRRWWSAIVEVDGRGGLSMWTSRSAVVVRDATTQRRTGWMSGIVEGQLQRLERRGALGYAMVLPMRCSRETEWVS